MISYFVLGCFQSKKASLLFMGMEGGVKGNYRTIHTVYYYFFSVIVHYHTYHTYCTRKTLCNVYDF